MLNIKHEAFTHVFVDGGFFYAEANKSIEIETASPVKSLLLKRTR